MSFQCRASGGYVLIWGVPHSRGIRPNPHQRGRIPIERKPLSPSLPKHLTYLVGLEQYYGQGDDQRYFPVCRLWSTRVGKGGYSTYKVCFDALIYVFFSLKLHDIFNKTSLFCCYSIFHTAKRAISFMFLARTFRLVSFFAAVFLFVEPPVASSPCAGTSFTSCS